ncbi:MAG: EAL domain-containing protein [Actinobacteria bacterium]|nr:EAL domain-containing protein [Actinomycetota bacterium]
MDNENLTARAERTLAACAEVIEKLGRAVTWEKVVPEILELLGGATGADRVYLFENSEREDGELLQDLTYEWTAPGISNTIEDPYNHAWPYSEGWGRVAALLSAGEVACGPIAAFSPTERVDLADEGVLSAALVPVFAGQGWWGYLGFDDCTESRDWSTVEIAALRAGAAAIGSAIHRENLDQERRSAEAYLRSHLEHLPAATYIEVMSSAKELGYEEAFVSPQIEGLTGYTQEEWLGDEEYLMWDEMIHPDDKQRVEEHAKRTAESGESYVDEYRLKHRKTGEWIWIRDQSHLVDVEGSAPYWHGFLVDITEQKKAQEQLAYVAQHDRLTDLPNRPMFEQLLDLALARALRSDLGVAVLYVDLDNFKLVNNSLGHDGGDELIRQLAERLKGAVRETDLVARQGADEFLVLLADIELEGEDGGPTQDAGVTTAESVVTRIQSALASPFEIEGVEMFATASIGVSLFPSSAADAQSLLTQADAATYRSKQIGPGGYAIFTPETDETVDQLSFRTRLRKAVDDRVWSLHYQPLVESETGHMIGVEALLRWEDPEKGFISPGEFIPLAEETGLIVEIGDWVAEELFRQAKAWREQGIELEEISFNVSPRQLWSPKLVETIFGHLEASAFDADRVVIEITESASMVDPEGTLRILHDLHDRGFRLAIDDFGTGYSSLSRLKGMPVSILKIDRSFVKDIPEDPDAIRMASAIVSLAKSLGMRPLAEGIETAEQQRFLVEMGCELGQGYYFSRPVPPSGIEEIFGRGSMTVMADDTAP